MGSVHCFLGNKVREPTSEPTSRTSEEQTYGRVEQHDDFGGYRGFFDYTICLRHPAMNGPSSRQLPGWWFDFLFSRVLINGWIWLVG